uniref:ribosomal protein L4 n=1 Tax=Tsunamia transpacifica TaxID=1935457 RepID=UPI001BEF542D|nr:ribosomal protein L4 [Tsunamia transpacifica]QUE27851.1 ribosomal protein L4 [Tsunamia transpacifica]UNJ14367.1 ribosomal protein L4 [Tsunamia transpacifica]
MVIQTELEYSIYDTEGNTSSKSTISLKIATVKSSYLVHRAMVKQQAEQRQGTASTKTRSEVRGGGKKPWKQKGSGKARAGSNRSPLWKGGGVTFGPKTRSYRKKMNRKEWRLALRTLLHNKYNKTLVVESIDSYFSVPSTRAMAELLKRWSIDLNQKTLIISESQNKNIFLSLRNIPQVKMLNAANLNILDLLGAEHIVITKEAISIIQEVFNE